MTCCDPGEFWHFAFRILTAPLRNSQDPAGNGFLRRSTFACTRWILFHNFCFKWLRDSYFADGSRKFAQHLVRSSSCTDQNGAKFDAQRACRPKRALSIQPSDGLSRPPLVPGSGGAIQNWNNACRLAGFAMDVEAGKRSRVGGCRKETNIQGRYAGQF